ncbi:MAG: hypothetical protein F9K45_11285, partial [Melioribacteraceae bacterium]
MHASSFTVNFLIRPKWSLIKFIYDEEEHKTSAEIKQILNYLYYYGYLKNILISYLDKKKILSLNKEEFAELLDKIEKLGVETYLDDVLNTALKSMAEFFNIGTTQKTKVPLPGIYVFLKEKKLSDHINRLNNYFGTEEKINQELRDIQKVLGSLKTKQKDLFEEINEDEIEKKHPELHEEIIETEDEIEEEEIENNNASANEIADEDKTDVEFDKENAVSEEDKESGNNIINEQEINEEEKIPETYEQTANIIEETETEEAEIEKEEETPVEYETEKIEEEYKPELKTEPESESIKEELSEEFDEEIEEENTNSTVNKIEDEIDEQNIVDEEDEKLDEEEPTLFGNEDFENEEETEKEIDESQPIVAENN